MLSKGKGGFTFIKFPLKLNNNCAFTNLVFEARLYVFPVFCYFKTIFTLDTFDLVTKKSILCITRIRIRMLDDKPN